METKEILLIRYCLRCADVTESLEIVNHAIEQKEEFISKYGKQHYQKFVVGMAYSIQHKRRAEGDVLLKIVYADTKRKWYLTAKFTAFLVRLFNLKYRINGNKLVVSKN